MAAVSHMMLLAGGRRKVLTYQTHAENGAGASSYSFTSQPFGTAQSDRYIIVGIGWANLNPTISSVSIGGVSATNIATNANANGSSALYIALVPTGTSGNVDITFSGTTNLHCGIAIWSATGLTSTTAVSSGNSSASATPSVTLTTVAGGFAVAYAHVGSNVSYSNTTVPWTGVTQDWAGNVISNSRPHGGGSVATTGSNVSPSPTFVGGNGSLVAASW